MTDRGHRERHGVTQNPAARRHLVRAQRQVEAGDLAAARQSYEQALAADSDNKAAWLGLAALITEPGLARALYQRILQKWPDCPEALQGLETLDERGGAPDPAPPSLDEPVDEMLQGPLRAGAPIYRGSRKQADESFLLEPAASPVGARPLAEALLPRDPASDEPVEVPLRRMVSRQRASGALPGRMRTLLAGMAVLGLLLILIASLSLLGVSLPVLVQTSGLVPTPEAALAPAVAPDARLAGEELLPEPAPDSGEVLSVPLSYAPTHPLALRYLPHNRVERWIEIDLERGQLIAHQGEQVVHTLSVGVLRAADWSGASDASVAGELASWETQLFVSGVPARLPAEGEAMVYALDMGRGEARWLAGWLGGPISHCGELVMAPNRIIIPL